MQGPLKGLFLQCSHGHPPTRMYRGPEYWYWYQWRRLCWQKPRSVGRRLRGIPYGRQATQPATPDWPRGAGDDHTSGRQGPGNPAWRSPTAADSSQGIPPGTPRLPRHVSRGARLSGTRSSSPPSLATMEDAACSSLPCNLGCDLLPLCTEALSSLCIWMIFGV